MCAFRKVHSKRITANGVIESEENLAIESVLEIVSSGEVIAAFVCTPGFEHELALGYLISTGIVSSFDDIEDITIENMRAIITLHEGVTISIDKEFSQNRWFMSTEFLTPELLIELRTGENIPKIKDGFDLDFNEIFAVSEQMWEYQEIHKKTQNTHAALVGDLMRNKHIVAEDIGRRNAVDKAIGLALMDGTNLSKSYLFSTGRLTADVVSKCAWASIPLLISFAVTTDAGLMLAQKANITLVGYVKGKSCRLYHEGAARLIR